MNRLTRKLIAGAATTAMLWNTVLGTAFATTTIEITGNGAGTNNWSDVSQTTTTTVNQSNVANVTNDVDADASTGGNDANFNTGGDVLIHTGDADVDVDVQNILNSNSAHVDCCISGDTAVEISGNGAFSDNTVLLDQATTTAVGQYNDAYVSNYVDADAKTGDNDALKNTDGDVTIVTGDAEVDVDVSTLANVNTAVVGSANDASNPSASFVISGNGAGTDNYISATLAKVTSVDQNNYAYVSNYVDADAKTGKNDAGFNTGGEVVIATGDATVMADVENAVNFNWADVDCGCTWDVLAKIAGNGADPDHHDWWWEDPNNTITLNLDSIQAVGQGNVFYLYNNLDDLNAKTGHNDVESNTADPEGDPVIITGDALIESAVENSGNVNTVGDVSPFPMPEWPDFDFSFDMSAMWAFFGMSA